jgi:hypothetical protein
VKRRIFNLLAAISTLLCATCITLLFRGLFVGDRLTLRPSHSHRVYSVDAYSGAIEFTESHGFNREFRRDYHHPGVLQTIDVEKPKSPSPRVFEYANFAGPLDQGRFTRAWLLFRYIPINWQPPTLTLPVPSPIPKGWREMARGTVVQGITLSIPDWVLLAIFSLLPFRWWFLSRKDRSQPGQCPSCGYDLRATPNRCPECGAVNKKIPILNQPIGH